MTHLYLSAKGLNNFFNYDKDFTFILDQEQVKTSKYIATFLSPIIAELFLSNPSLSFFILAPSCTITN